MSTGNNKSEPRDLAGEADSAFKSPTQLTSRRGLKSKHQHQQSSTDGNRSVASSAGQSRRSRSVKSPKTADLFEHMSQANSVRVAKARKKAVEDGGGSETGSNVSYPVDEFMRGVNAAALTLMRSVSPTSSEGGTMDVNSPFAADSVGAKSDASNLWEFASAGKNNNDNADQRSNNADNVGNDNATAVTAGSRESSHRTPLDLHRNDNAFYVLANLLVEFLNTKLTQDGNTVVLQPEDRVRMERVLPESVRLDFIDAVRHRLGRVPETQQQRYQRKQQGRKCSGGNRKGRSLEEDEEDDEVSVLMEVTLQCKEYGLDREGRMNPILVAANLQDEPSFIPVQSVLAYGTSNDDDTTTVATRDIAEMLSPTNTYSFQTNPSVPLPSHAEGEDASDDEEEEDGSSDDGGDEREEEGRGGRGHEEPWSPNYVVKKKKKKKKKDRKPMLKVDTKDEDDEEAHDPPALTPGECAEDEVADLSKHGGGERQHHHRHHHHHAVEEDALSQTSTIHTATAAEYVYPLADYNEEGSADGGNAPSLSSHHNTTRSSHHTASHGGGSTRRGDDHPYYDDSRYRSGSHQSSSEGLTAQGFEATESQYLAAVARDGRRTDASTIGTRSTYHRSRPDPLTEPKPDPSATQDEDEDGDGDDDGAMIPEEDPSEDYDENRLVEMAQNPMGTISPRNQALADRLRKHRELVERIHQKQDVSDLWSNDTETTATRPSVIPNSDTKATAVASTATGGPPGTVAGNPSAAASPTSTKTSQQRDRWLEKEREVEEWFQRRELEAQGKTAGTTPTESVVSPASLASPRNENGERTMESAATAGDTRLEKEDYGTARGSSRASRQRDPTPRESQQQQKQQEQHVAPSSVASPSVATAADDVASKKSKVSIASTAKESEAGDNVTSKKSKKSVVSIASTASKSKKSAHSESIRASRLPPQPEDAPSIGTAHSRGSRSTQLTHPAPENFFSRGEETDAHSHYQPSLADVISSTCTGSKSTQEDHSGNSENDGARDDDKYKSLEEKKEEEEDLSPNPTRDDPSSTEKSHADIVNSSLCSPPAILEGMLSPKSDVNAGAAMTDLDRRPTPPGVVYLEQTEEQRPEQNKEEDDESNKIPSAPNTAPAAMAPAPQSAYPFSWFASSNTPTAAEVPAAPSTTTAAESYQYAFWKSPNQHQPRPSHQPPPSQQPPQQQQHLEQQDSHPTFSHRTTTPAGLFTTNPFSALAVVANPFAVGGSFTGGGGPYDAISNPGGHDDDDDDDDDELIDQLEQQKKAIKIKARASSSDVSPSSGLTSAKASTVRTINDPTVIAKQQIMAELREASNLMEESENLETAKFWKEHIFDLENQLRVLNGQEPEISPGSPGGDGSITRKTILDNNRRLVSEIEHREKYLPREATPEPTIEPTSASVVSERAPSPAVQQPLPIFVTAGVAAQEPRPPTPPLPPITTAVASGGGTELISGEDNIPSNAMAVSTSSSMQPPSYVNPPLPPVTTAAASGGGTELISGGDNIPSNAMAAAASGGGTDLISGENNIPSNAMAVSPSSTMQPPSYVNLGENASKGEQQAEGYVPPKIETNATSASHPAATKPSMPSPDAASAKGVELTSSNEPDRRPAPRVYEDLPLVDVVAPADLPAGYHFEAELEGKRFLATVPPGGVQQGETFTCYMRELNSVAIDIPVGYWKDGLSNLCDYGCCHSVIWNSFFCPLVALGQVQTRVGFDFLGRPLQDPRSKKEGGTPQHWTNRAVMLTVILSWISMNFALYACYNWKWSRGLDLSMADMAALGVVNAAMYFFAVFATQSTRSSLREKFMIREQCCHDLEDVCLSSFCLPCTVGQMARHTANYDDYEAVCCSKTGLPDGVRVNQRPKDLDGYVV